MGKKIKDHERKARLAGLLREAKKGIDPAGEKGSAISKAMRCGEVRELIRLAHFSARPPLSLYLLTDKGGETLCQLENEGY